MNAGQERLLLEEQDKNRLIKHVEYRKRIRELRNILCKGCFYLSKKEQVQFYEDDSKTKIVPPRKVIMAYCTKSGLHLEFMDRIIMESDEDKPKCSNYWVPD